MIGISITGIVAVISFLFMAMGFFLVGYLLLRRFRLSRAGSPQYRKLDSLAREPIVREKETIIKEKEIIYKVKCSYCGRSYDEVLDVCPHCGGKR